MSGMSQQEEGMEIAKMIESGARAGTHVKTKFMRPFIKKREPERYIIDVEITWERIRAVAKFINRVGAERLMVCSKMRNAKAPVKKFCEAVGARERTGRFMPGTLTNPSLPKYEEPGLVLVSDPQFDEQAVIEATNAGIPVIGLANTDNITSNLDIVIPANNNGNKSIAMIYWLLARQVLIERGGDGSMEYQVGDFESKEDEDDGPRRAKWSD